MKYIKIFNDENELRYKANLTYKVKLDNPDNRPVSTYDDFTSDYNNILFYNDKNDKIHYNPTKVNVVAFNNQTFTGQHTYFYKKKNGKADFQPELISFNKINTPNINDIRYKYVLEFDIYLNNANNSKYVYFYNSDFASLIFYSPSSDKYYYEYDSYLNGAYNAVNVNVCDHLHLDDQWLHMCCPIFFYIKSEKNYSEPNPYNGGNPWPYTMFAIRSGKWDSTNTTTMKIENANLYYINV